MLLKSYLGVMALRGLSQLLALLYVALVTAVVSPAEFGRFNLVLSVALVLGAALLSWPNQALLRYGREDLQSQGTFGGILGARLALHGLLLLFILPVLLLFSPYLASVLDVQPWPLALMLGLVLVVFPAADLSTVVAQVGSRFFAYGLSPLIQRLAQLAVLGLVLVGVPMSWDVLLWGNVAGYAIAAALVAWMVPWASMRPVYFDPNQIKRIFSYSWAMPLASLSAFLMSQMGLWFLGYFNGVDTVGIYAWAFNVSLLATSLLVPLSAVLAPRTIDLHIANRRQDLLDFLRLSSGVIILAAALLPAGLGLLLFFVPLLPLGAYSAALGPLLIFTAGTVFQLGMALMEPVMFAHERLVTRTVLLISGMAVLSVVQNLLLIPPWGMEGAALATAGAYAFGMAVEWLWFARKLGVEGDFQPGLTCLGATVPMLLVALLPASTRESGLVVTLACSLCLLVLGRRLRLFQGLGILLPRLKSSWRPVVAWLAVS